MAEMCIFVYMYGRPKYPFSNKLRTFCLVGTPANGLRLELKTGGEGYEVKHHRGLNSLEQTLRRLITLEFKKTERRLVVVLCYYTHIQVIMKIVALLRQ